MSIRLTIKENNSYDKALKACRIAGVAMITDFEVFQLDEHDLRDRANLLSALATHLELSSSEAERMIKEGKLLQFKPSAKSLMQRALAVISEPNLSEVDQAALHWNAYAYAYKVLRRLSFVAADLSGSKMRNHPDDFVRVKSIESFIREAP